MGYSLWYFNLFICYVCSKDKRLWSKIKRWKPFSQGMRWGPGQNWLCRGAATPTRYFQLTPGKLTKQVYIQCQPNSELHKQNSNSNDLYEKCKAFIVFRLINWCFNQSLNSMTEGARSRYLWSLCARHLIFSLLCKRDLQYTAKIIINVIRSVTATNQINWDTLLNRPCSVLLS